MSSFEDFMYGAQDGGFVESMDWLEEPEMEFSHAVDQSLDFDATIGTDQPLDLEGMSGPDLSFDSKLPQAHAAAALPPSTPLVENMAPSTAPLLSGQGGMLGTTSSRRRTRKEWEHIRPLIKRLYVDEHKELTEVVAFLEGKGFVATEKMFKDHIRKWKFNRNNNEHNMRAAYRKTMQRQAVGKQTRIRIRGRDVSIERVLHYFKRKRMENILEMIAVEDAPTPSDVSSRTPSPTLTPQPLNFDSHVVVRSSRSPSQQVDAVSSLTLETNHLVVAARKPWQTRLSTPDEEINFRYSDLGEMYQALATASEVVRSPTPPQKLLALEEVFVSIRTYLGAAFDSGELYTNSDGLCVSRNATTQDPANFYNFCLSAAKLLSDGSYIEGRRLLSRAFSMIQALLHDERPDALVFFLATFIQLQKRGLPEVFIILRNYISQLASSMMTGTSRKRSADVCLQICQLDVEDIEIPFGQFQLCLKDAVVKHLGPLHMLSINMNYEALGEELNTAKILQQEGSLREILRQCEHIHGPSDMRCVHLRIRLVYNLMRQARFEDAEPLIKENLTQGSESRNYSYHVLAIEQLSIVRHLQGDFESAERYLRMSHSMAKDRWGEIHSLSLGLMFELQRLLHSLGRYDEANELRVQRDKLLGPDDIEV